MNILELAGIEEVCARIEEGMTHAEIVDLLGVDRVALNQFLYREGNRKRYQEAQLNSASAFLDRGKNVLIAAQRKTSIMEPTIARALEQHFARRAALANPRYIERTAHEVSGPGGAPVQQVQLTTAEFAEIARKAAQDI